MYWELRYKLKYLFFATGKQITWHFEETINPIFSISAFKAGSI